VTPLLTLEYFFIGCGVVLAIVAAQIAGDATHPKRRGSALFWLLLAVAVGGGSWLPHAAVGYAVAGLTVLTAMKQVGVPQFAASEAGQLEARARRLGNRVLWPVPVVPAVAVTGGLVLERVSGAGFVLASARQAPQIALGLGCAVALVLALKVTGERPLTAVREGGRLLQLLGWALLLPQMLAALGRIMAKAGVGDAIAQVVATVLPVHLPGVAVLAYCGGMALFTILLGNAFAAFPVMTLGVGLPIIVKAHGGDPAVMGVPGMPGGYCGTLVSPMAANFNLVPVKLLELRDDYAVIKAQVPYAPAIWVFTATLMYFGVYSTSGR